MTLQKTQTWSQEVLFLLPMVAIFCEIYVQSLVSLKFSQFFRVCNKTNPQHKQLLEDTGMRLQRNLHNKPALPKSKKLTERECFFLAVRSPHLQASFQYYGWSCRGQVVMRMGKLTYHSCLLEECSCTSVCSCLWLPLQRLNAFLKTPHHMHTPTHKWIHHDVKKLVITDLNKTVIERAVTDSNSSPIDLKSPGWDSLNDWVTC